MYNLQSLYDIVVCTDHNAEPAAAGRCHDVTYYFSRVAHLHNLGFCCERLVVQHRLCYSFLYQHEPWSSRLEVKPGPPPATDPPLAPHLSGAGQKEYSLAPSLRVKRRRTGAATVATGSSKLPAPSSSHCTSTRVLLTPTTIDLRKTGSSPPTLSTSTCTPPSQLRNSCVLSAPHVTGRVTTVPPPASVATIGAHPSRLREATPTVQPGEMPMVPYPDWPPAKVSIDDTVPERVPLSSGIITPPVTDCTAP